MRPIVARRTVAAPPEVVFALLGDLGQHWRLTGRWVDAVALEAAGGVVRIRGPVGVVRTAVTRVVDAEPPFRLAGEALLGATRAAVSWTLVAGDRGTTVTLRAEILRSARSDRLLLALGGRRWMQRRFRATLQRLSDETAVLAREREAVTIG